MDALFAPEESRPTIRWCSTPSGVLQAILMHALLLKQEYGEVYILCDIQGCSITETAEILNVTVEDVIRRLKRARSYMELAIARLCELGTSCADSFSSVPSWEHCP